MTIEDKQPKVYSLKVTFECPPGIKKECVEKYVKDHVFIEGWAGIFATNYLDIKEFTFSDCPVSVPSERTCETCQKFKCEKLRRNSKFVKGCRDWSAERDAAIRKEEQGKALEAFATIESWINRNAPWKPGTDERYCNARMLLAILKTQKGIIREDIKSPQQLGKEQP